MVTQTEAIGKLLTALTKADLAALYTPDMEVQVNVAQDSGEIVQGEYNGRTWRGYSDGVQTWKPFRIPRNAKTEPEYEARDMSYDLAAHAEGIGMTGWNWALRCSLWVAFDFDSLINHKVGLTADEMSEIQHKVSDIEWVTIRKSTSGSGLHIYVFLPEVPTANHDEHAALGRAVLGQLSALTGIDLTASVDSCGGNMWVWHRKTRGTDGLSLIKSGRHMRENEVPVNWRDHVSVVTGKRRRNLPQVVEQNHVEDFFADLTNQRPVHELLPEHVRLIEFLRTVDALWWYDNDHNMLVTHTHWLKKAHESLALRGVFDTNSAGKNLNEQNCFCFPQRRGAWSVRRFTRGVEEASSWEQDSSGWTKCTLNSEPTIEQACRSSTGLEDDKGIFNFRYAGNALDAVAQVATRIEIRPEYIGRKATIKNVKNGKIAIEIAAEDGDDLPGWLRKDKGHAIKGSVWQRIATVPSAQDCAGEDIDGDSYDDLIRHLVTADKKEYGWVININGAWHHECPNNIKLVLKAQGFTPKDTDNILGVCIQRCWTLVQKPFEPEYTGNREWNINAAQLRFSPALDKDSDVLHFPTWERLFRHIGLGLDEAVAESKWCQANSVLSGADYLKLWLASLIKEPFQPLPYLFLYGTQNCGKSAFHESIARLLTTGAIDASAALTSGSGFNKELGGSVLCSIEEINLNKNQQAYNRIKDWVTSAWLLVHEKGQTPFRLPNSTHWVQCANDPEYCPVFHGDTRIVMINVPPLDVVELIPRKEFNILLEKEAPDFLAHIMLQEIPKSGDRLNIPILVTEDKEMAAELNETPLEAFIRASLVQEIGSRESIGDLFDAFQMLHPADAASFSRKALSAALVKAGYQRGRDKIDTRVYYCNVRIKDKPKPADLGGKWFARGGYLVQEARHAESDL